MTQPRDITAMLGSIAKPSVMDAARALLDAADRFEQRHAEIVAEADRWEAARVAAQRAYFAHRLNEESRHDADDSGADNGDDA